uniref:Peptidase S1 domain-containing protein n=1 Tax=Timema poppense TaxID=170557 RepID=A0A7R9CTZ7_TIMPO|nr:unnamed protein product [Timema poppensis]
MNTRTKASFSSYSGFANDLEFEAHIAAGYPEFSTNLCEMFAPTKHRLSLSTVGKRCSMKSGKMGVCRAVTDCPALLSLTGFTPDICGFQSDQLVVCCGMPHPHSTTTSRPYRDSPNLVDKPYKRVEDNQAYRPSEVLYRPRRPHADRPWWLNDSPFEEKPPGRPSNPSFEDKPQHIPPKPTQSSFSYPIILEEHRQPPPAKLPPSKPSPFEERPPQRPANQPPKFQQRPKIPSTIQQEESPRPTFTDRPPTGQLQQHSTEKPWWISEKPFVEEHDKDSNPADSLNRPPSRVKPIAPPSDSSKISFPNQFDFDRRPTYSSSSEPSRPNQSPSNSISQFPDPPTHTTNTNRPSGSANKPFRPSERPLYINPPFRPGAGTTKKPVKRRISELMRDNIMALPLLPDPEPISVQVEKCNYNSVKLIVGGEETVPGEFPHMWLLSVTCSRAKCLAFHLVTYDREAAVGFQEGRQIVWKCGGSLISEHFVLTAAHCTYSSLGPPVVVRLGEYNLRTNYEDPKPVDYSVAEVIRHPDYKSSTHYNDIGLLRLSRPAELNSFVRPACLYSKNMFNVNKTTAIGWGNIDFAEDPSDILLKVSLSIIPNNQCNQMYHSESKTNELAQGILPSMLCAGELAGGKDTCQGDSGGPIQISNKNNHCIHYIIGVTSFGKFCAGKNAPGVYTRVSYFLPWIESIVWSSN